MKKNLLIVSTVFSVFLSHARIQQLNPELLVAAAHNDLGTLQELLDAGVSIEVMNDEGKTALILAAELGQEAAVRFLLDRGAHPDAAMVGEATSCTEEESPDFPPVCATILPGQKPPFVRRQGWTALHFAVENGYKKIAKILLKKGKASVDAGDAQLKTPLMVAAKKGDLSLVKLLLRSEAQVNAKSDTNRSALYYAVAYADRTGKNGLAVVKELVAHGAAVDDEIIVAAEHRLGHRELMEILMSPKSTGSIIVPA